MADIENIQRQARAPHNNQYHHRSSSASGGENNHYVGNAKRTSGRDRDSVPTKGKRHYNKPSPATRNNAPSSRSTRNKGEQRRQGPASPEKTVIEDKKAGQTYTKGKLLGRGGFAKCYTFTHVGTKHVCAGKCVNKKSIENNSRARAKLHSEIRIHRSLKHRLVVRFEHFFEDSDYVYILLELCTQRTLLELVRRKQRLKESHARWFIVQILDAVKYLHSVKVIHRDLKLGNVFLTENMEIRLGDFGLATRLEYPEQRKKTVCGTPNYIAPEIICGRSGHSFEVDIWSMGIILYTLLIGKPPFETKDVKATYKRIQANDYSFPSSSPISETAKDLIVRILTIDPKRRPSLEEIRHHPFCAESNRKALSTVRTSGNVRTSGYSTVTTSKPSTIISSALRRDSSSKSQKALEEEVKSVDTIMKGLDLDTKQKTQALKSEQEVSKKVHPIMSSQNHLSKGSSPMMSIGSANNTPVLASNPATTRSSATSSSSEGIWTNVWVTKWVDYTSKYGLGYLLRGGVVGVYFNDSTKLVVAQDRTRFEYYTRQSDSKQSYFLDDYPKELEKKVTLLKHFRSYLEKKKNQDMQELEYRKWAKQDRQEREAEAEIRLSESKGLDLPYVKKWVRTRHAIFFKLSNRKVQVAFFDGTYILLSAMQKLVTYIDKEDRSETLPVDEAASNHSIETRLKYTKEVLHQLIASKDRESKTTSTHRQEK